MFYTRKSKGLTLLEAWFQAPNLSVRKKYLASFLQNVPKIVLEEGEYILQMQERRTLVTDLTLSEDELMLRCERNVRNEIRRSKKDGAQCRHYLSEELRSKEDLLRQFDESYVEMHRTKGMVSPSVYSYLQQLIQANILCISTCLMEDHIIVYHVYVIGDSIARLLYSVSVFRNSNDGALRSAIGRGNRMLHYEDMIWFKKHGYTCYDWGGYSSNPALENINAFKRGFGGEQRPRFYMVTTSKKWVKIMHSLLTISKRCRR